MRILTRYLIRAHVGPFLFAVSTLTGLLFLNAVAQRLEDLAGKGLEWDVIVEFLYLSLPHTVALTLPMAVLVAVLYAFSELTANNEVTAMKAGGIRPQRMMLPLLGVGVIVAGVMLFFNDRVLPEANHHLRNLLLDINRKSPTFVLREQVVNRIPVGNEGDVFYLTASTIDNATSELTEVAIYDGSDPNIRRTTYAERGVMEFNEARTDLYLTLYDGVSYETSLQQPGDFRQRRFDREVLPLRGVGNEMERRAGGAHRSDREMTLAMLDSVADTRHASLQGIRENHARTTRAMVLQGLGRDPSADPEIEGEDVADRDSLGVVALDPANPLNRPNGADRAGQMNQANQPDEADPAGQMNQVGRSNQADRLEDDGTRTLMQRDELTRAAVRTSRTDAVQARMLREQVSRYRVELHKKYALAFACIVFVLLGGPLAIRFPRGGLGMVIAASSAIFAVYWAGLIGGESLADRGVAPPALTMWIPNLVFTGLGLWLFVTMGREAATTRGGGWDDLFWTLRKRVGLGGRRSGRSRAPGTGGEPAEVAS